MRFSDQLILEKQRQSSLLKSDTERNINLAFRAIHNCTPKQIHTQINDAKSTLKHLLLIPAYETWTVKAVIKLKYLKLNISAMVKVEPTSI